MKKYDLFWESSLYTDFNSSINFFVTVRLFYGADTVILQWYF